MKMQSIISMPSSLTYYYRHQMLIYVVDFQRVEKLNLGQNVVWKNNSTIFSLRLGSVLVVEASE